ncbi:MAG: hypothetical protein Kow0042_25300 [Calditrichia bacterium]
MTQIVKTEALVVQGLRWSDTSKIVHLFTRDKGYIKAIAKGALRPRSVFHGLVENLNQIEAVISIRETRGLQVLTQATLINAFSSIRDDLESTAVAFAMMEMIKASLHYNENAETLYLFTTDLLTTLDRAPKVHVILYLIRFMLFLSEYLGFGWNFEVCRMCGNPPNTPLVIAEAVNGAIVCHRCRSSLSGGETNLTLPQWEFMREFNIVQPGEIPEKIKSLSPHLNYQPVLDILIAHLNYHTEQTLELKSLKMFLS